MGVAPGAPLHGVELGELPGGYGNTTHGEDVRRGVGYGVGIKNICFSEGFDDYATAKVRLQVVGGEPAATVHTAAAEVGQGLVTLQAQVARTELGVEQVTVEPADTSVGSAGSSSASRQSYMTGGAVKLACEVVRPHRRPRRAPAARGEAGGRQGRVGDLGRPRRPGRRARRRRRRGDRGVTPPAHRALDPLTGQGKFTCAARVVRARGGRRRRHRTGAGQGGGAGRGPGCGPDPARVALEESTAARRRA